MLENDTHIHDSELAKRLSGYSIQDNKNRQDCVGLTEIPYFYSGLQLQFLFTFTYIDLSTETFKKQILHAYYVFKMLLKPRKSRSKC